MQRTVIKELSKNKIFVFRTSINDRTFDLNQDIMFLQPT